MECQFSRESRCFYAGKNAGVQCWIVAIDRPPFGEFGFWSHPEKF